ncbi:MAG: prolyl oligopeptidase family serine peptidase [Alistipes sp.]|nr:prolyl oligopeptidase family serine peptidase [Alistipes sp.]
MKRILLLLVALCASSGVLSAADYVRGWSEHKMKHGGVERDYTLYLPEKLSEDAPLVVMLHGYGSRSKPTRYGLHEAAERHGFAVCYPRGAKDHRDKACWNVGYAFHLDKEHRYKVDDVAFITRLVRHLQREYGLNRHNTFLTGMSNGGEMCYLMAYLRPELFAAVAPVSGLTMEWMYRELRAKRPVPVFEIHGTLDKTSAWNGDLANKGGWGAYIGVPQAVGYWAAQCGCTHEECEELPLLRNKVIAHRYVNGTEGRQVWLYEVVGGKHSWAEKDMNTAEELWKFFSLYLK